MDTLLSINNAVVSVDTLLTQKMLDQVFDSIPWPLDLLKDIIMLLIPLGAGYLISNKTRDNECRYNLEMKKIETFNENIKCEIMELKKFRQEYKLFLDDIRVKPDPNITEPDEYKAAYMNKIRSNVKKLDDLKRRYIGSIENSLIDEINKIVDLDLKVSWEEAVMQSSVKGDVDVNDFNAICEEIDSQYSDIFVNKIKELTNMIDALIMNLNHLVESYKVVKKLK